MIFPSETFDPKIHKERRKVKPLSGFAYSSMPENTKATPFFIELARTMNQTVPKRSLKRIGHFYDPKKPTIGHYDLFEDPRKPFTYKSKKPRK